MSEGDKDSRDKLPAPKMTKLDALPPPPLSSSRTDLTKVHTNEPKLKSSSSKKTPSPIHIQMDAVPAPSSLKNPAKSLNQTLTSTTNIQSSILNNTPTLTISKILTPRKTPISLKKYIQSAQNDLDQMNKQLIDSNNTLLSSPSPKTPCKNIISPELVEYILSTEKQMDDLLKEVLSPTPVTPSKDFMSPELVEYIASAEKEMDRMLKDTLATPMASKRNSCSNLYEDSLSSSFLEGIKRDLSFDESMVEADGDEIDVKETDANTGTEDDVRKCDSSTGETGILSGRWKLYFIHKAILLPTLMALFFVLLGSIDPASPLLTPYHQPSTGAVCNVDDIEKDLSSECTVATTPKPSYLTKERFKLGLATFSFGVATSIRTISAPLYRLDNKIKSRQHNIHLIQQIINLCNQFARKMEQYSYETWEDAAKSYNVLKDSSLSSLQSRIHNPLELDLGLLVPCDASEARIYLLQNEEYKTQEPNSDLCPLRDVISHELLMEYATINIDSDFSLTAHPLILRNLWPPDSFDITSTNHRRLTPSGILNDPQLSSFILPNYFADATKTGYSALVPDSSQISLSQFVKNILSGITPYAKIGTQSIIEAYPELHEEIVQPKLAKELFGWNPWLDEFKERISKQARTTFGRLLQMLPPSTYYPVFIAGQSADKHARTDLHTEPIGNIAVQLHGHRHWTLIPAKWSGLLRPTVSKHGRGYIYSSLDPIVELPKRVEEIPLVWKCITNRGDALWM